MSSTSPNRVELTYVIEIFKDMEYAEEIEYSYSYDNYEEAKEAYNQETEKAKGEYFIRLNLEITKDEVDTQIIDLVNNWQDSQGHVFIHDLDKMYDFFRMSKDAFLESYSYLTKFDYYKTLDMITPEVLADLMREAENLHIEDMNGRPYTWNVNGEQLKTVISDYANTHLSVGGYADFIELCDSMGI